MRQLAPTATVLFFLIPVHAVAQDAQTPEAAVEVETSVAVAPESDVVQELVVAPEEPEPEPIPVPMVSPVPVPVTVATPQPPPPPAAPLVREDPVGEGLRLFLGIQTNANVGELVDSGGGGFAFERATLTGVPDAIVGVRIGRLSAGLGFTWSQISTDNQQMNPCTAQLEDFALTQTLFGVLPSVRFDVLTTNDGRGRMDLGATVPLLLSSRSQEVATFNCPGTGRDVNDTADGVYGVNVHFGGRYHLWDALTLGLEVGLSYLVFDQDENPDTPAEEPTVTTLTVYSGLNLALELPL